MKTSFIVRRLAAFAFTVAMWSAHPGTASADTPALTISGGNDVPPSAGFTLGWGFTLSSTVTVSQLGLWDSGSNGFGEAHAIGIYTSAGSTPLVSTTIAAGSGATLLNNFRYVSVTPTILGAGTYNIGAYYTTTVDNINSTGSTVTPASGVTFNFNRFIGGASLANPTTANVSNGFFGPNFQTVPEPATGLLALGGAAVLLARRRRAALSRRLAQTPL